MATQYSSTNTYKVTIGHVSENYTGSDNLEVMLEAVNYNNFLMSLVHHYSNDQSPALDFGAGIGTYTAALTLPAREVYCIEPDLQAQALLKSRGHPVFSDIDQLEGESFSYVYSLNVLEHIDDDLKIAVKLAGLMKPGATLFVYVPAFNHLRTSMDDLVGHHRRYTRKSLMKLLNSAGLEVEEAAYTDFLGYFATIAFKFLDAVKSAPDGKINKPMLVIYDRVFFPASRLLSLVFCRLMGKNVYAVAKKPV